LEIVRTDYVPAPFRRFFGKTPPDIIWITARKPHAPGTVIGSSPLRTPPCRLLEPAEK
jgi:hypothetical protein